MKSYLVEFAWLIGFLALCIIQISFVASSSLLAASGNLIVIASFLLIVFRHPVRALILALAGGYLMDLSSAFPFGLMTVALVLGVYVFIVLHQKFLKNRAVHAFALNSLAGGVTVAGTILVGLLVFRQAGALAFSRFGWQSFMELYGLQVLFQAVTVSMVFFIWKYVRRYFIQVRSPYDD